jgi:O-antigen ligase
MFFQSFFLSKEILNIKLSVFFQTTLWCTLFFIVSVYTIKNPIKILRKSKQFFYILMIFLCSLYLLSRGEELNTYLSYYAVAIVPWVLLNNNRNLKIFGILFISIVVLFSTKRGGFLALSLSLVIYLYTNRLPNKIKKGWNIVVFFISVTLLTLVISFLIESLNINILSRISNMLDDGGSGRLKLYDQLFILFFEFDIFQFIFGNGHNATQEVTGDFAHNEFFQFLFDYGLIGLLLYIYLHKILITKCIELYKNKSPYIASFLSSYIIFILLALVSHWFLMPLFVIILTCYWALIFALTNQKVNLNNALKFKNN